MNTIKLTDSELYELLLEVCDELGYNEYMPATCCMLTNHETGRQRAVVATSVGSPKPFVEGDDIKIYITTLVESSVKRYGSGGIFYPFKIQKATGFSKLILRGAYQPRGYKTNFRGDADKEIIKTQLDDSERGR